MYQQIWKKYLPIIKILFKKAIAEPQVLDLNKIDFERAGSGRKAGYKFSIHLHGSKVTNIISGSQLATDLALVMLDDEKIRTMTKQYAFEVSLNTKFQLSIQRENTE